MMTVLSKSCATLNSGSSAGGVAQQLQTGELLRGAIERPHDQVCSALPLRAQLLAPSEWRVRLGIRGAMTHIDSVATKLLVKGADLCADDGLPVGLQDATAGDVARGASDRWLLAVESFGGGLVELTGGFRPEASLDLTNSILGGVTDNVARDLVVGDRVAEVLQSFLRRVNVAVLK